MKQDRFLVGILIFIGLLVAAALSLFFFRKGSATYQADDTPEHVVYNFSLAIQQNELDRAYSYLADQDGKPTRVAFMQSIQNGNMNVNGNALQVDSSVMQGKDNALVYVTIQYMGSGPFDTGYSNPGQATLVRQNGAWKITAMPYPYWSGEWFIPTPMQVKP